MAAPVPKTKAGKERKIAATMGEFKTGDLKSSSGDKVTNPKQAVAIAMSQSGQSKPAPAAKPTQTERLAQKLDKRVDKRQERKR